MARLVLHRDRDGKHRGRRAWPLSEAAAKAATREPAAEAAIAPLPLPGFPAFEPFAYGDHLWAAMTRFVEFRGLEAARLPRGVRAA